MGDVSEAPGGNMGEVGEAVKRRVEEWAPLRIGERKGPSAW